MKRFWKKAAAAAVTLAMLGASLPADIRGFQLFGGSVMTTYAANSYTYAVYRWDDTTNELKSDNLSVYDTSYPRYTELDKDYLETEKYILEGTTGTSGDPTVFVVKSNLTIDKRITIKKGTRVDIVVPKDVTFKCVRGISCSCDKEGNHGTLRILGEGKVITTTTSKNASIGGDNKEVNGIIELHGPTVEASGGGYSAAIGGGYSEMDPDSAGEKSCIKIYDGIIRANSPADGAAIGGGGNQKGCKTYIYGGDIRASNTGAAAGIGGGEDEGTRGIYIYGGRIVAYGYDDGAGIGCGKDSGNLGDGIYIYGGNIEATGGADGAGIGGGAEADMNGTIEISGENTRVEARGGTRAAGIGAGCGCGSTISKGDMGGKITIDCGENSNIEVYGGSTMNPVDKGASSYPADEGGAAIGAAYQGNMNGKVWIKGGNIKLYSGYNAAGIGGGEESTLYQGGEGGKVYISGGKMEITLRNSNSDGRRGNEAIGAGANDSKSGSIYIHNNNNEGNGDSYMRVSYKDGDNWVAVKAGDRTGKLHSHKNVKVEPCDHSGGLSYSFNNVADPDQCHCEKCKYCGYEKIVEHSPGDCPCGKTGDCMVLFEEANGSSAIQACKDKEIALPGPSSIFGMPEGKTFAGWKLGDTIYEEDDSVLITADTTFTAQYRDLYTITPCGYKTVDIPDGKVYNYTSVSGDRSTADEGEEITVVTTTGFGCRLKSWSVRKNNADGEVLFSGVVKGNENEFAFKMPASNVYIDTEFEMQKFYVEIEENSLGTVEANKTVLNYYDEDNTVTLTVTPKAGYHLAEISIQKMADEDETEIVPEGSGSTYTFSMPDADVKVYAVFEENAHTDSYISGASLSLKGDIGVNIYLRPATDLDDGAYVTIKGPNDTVAEKIRVYNLLLTENGYKITRQLSAQQMGETIVVQLFDKDDNKLTLYGSDRQTEFTGYGPKNYFATVKSSTIFQNPEKQAKLVDLCTAMERYGEYARNNFGNNYDEVCNLTDDVVTPAVTAADINWPWLAEENDNLSLSEIEGSFEGATLSLKSETTLSFYFKFKDPDKARDFTVGNPNYTIEVKNTDPYTIVRVRGIKAKDLGNSIELEWKDGLVKYSPMNYCYNVVSGNYDENLKNVCKALYLYWQKAAAYFSKS